MFDLSTASLTVLYGNLANEIDRDTWKQADLWYVQAHRFCAGLASTYNRPIEQVAAIVAVYSMRTSWQDNQNRVIRYLASNGQDHAGTMVQYGKIFDIESVGTDVNAIRKILRGPKITRFFHNILFPTTSPYATIDSWMVVPLPNTVNYGHLASGIREYGSNLYIRIERAIRAIARMLGVPVATMQAALWIHLRGSGE